MERFCSILLPCIKNHRFPYANIDSYVTAVAQLSQIKNQYGLHQELTLKAPQLAQSPGQFSTAECMVQYLLKLGCHLLISSRSYMCPSLTTSAQTKTLSWPCQQNCYLPINQSAAHVCQFLVVDEIESWGKVERLDGGDTIRASELVKGQEDGREASYVWVCVLETSF